jgi:hypothetical protein
MCISVSSHAPGHARSRVSRRRSRGRAKASAGARRAGDLGRSRLPAQLRGWRIKLCSSKLEFVFSCRSCELVWRAGASPAEHGRMGNRSGCPTPETQKFASKRALAEREREGSAAKSIQRMSALWAVLYRGTTAPAWCANMQRARIHRREDRRWRILRRRAPSFWLPQEQLRVGSCSIGSRMAAAQALPARNETDKRSLFRGPDLQARQTRNDSKLQATIKW